MIDQKMILKPHEIITVFEVLNTIPENLDVIRARDVWPQSKQGEGIVVATLDTGVDKDHPDLKENIIGGYNFTGDDNGDPNIFTDYTGHGTHVAGIIAASDNGEGIVGVAPKSKILALKVIDKNGSGSYDNLIKAIQYATNWVGPNGERVNVINMSLGGPKPNDLLHKVIKEARQNGIVLVSAAGNQGDGDAESFEVSYPGYYKEVIQIGSITKDQKPSIFSNTNVNLDFVAPGENILSTHLNGRYVKLSGTSMAAPFVAGAVALILKLLDIDTSNPVMIPYLVYQYLLDHVKILDFPINQVGNGLIQLIS
ncbi:peptidase S8 [Bacillus sp. X1(2014)]|nr:peptidase S8 [Bacillus sp. X1(2014)]